MQEIGLYFGSFNPIHHGHLIIASHVYNETGLQKIWFVVSPQNPLKKNKSLLNEYHRLHLLRLALENDHQRFLPSDIEFKLPRPSYTIDTLTYLEEQYPEKKFSIIMGSDSFTNLQNWKNHHLILEKYKLYIYIRPGFPVVQDTGSNIVILQAPLLDISSTLIRKLIEQKKSIRYLVPDEVMEEINNNNYFQTISRKNKSQQ